MVSSLTASYSGPNPCLVQFYYFSSALAPQDSTLPTPAVSEHNSTSYSVHTARPSLAGYSSPTVGLSPVGHSAEYQVTNTFV